MKVDKTYEPGRRTFLKLTALAGAGISFGGFGLFSTDKLFAQAALAGSGGMAPVAVVDDAIALGLYDFELALPVQSMLQRHADLIRIAGGLEADEKSVSGLLTTGRSTWGQKEDAHMEKSAFAMGWIVRAVARPHLTLQVADEPQEGAVYRDAYLIRERAEDGALPKAAHVSEEDLAGLFDAIWHRTMIRLHTLIPDEPDGEAWISRFLAWQEARNAQVRSYATALLRPDSAKVKRYVLDTSFYNPEDPIIRFVRSVQRREPADPGAWPAVLEQPGGSRYARALAMSYQRLRTAAGVLDGRVSEAQFIDALGMR